jgi:hypothetical protein
MFRGLARLCLLFAVGTVIGGCVTDRGRELVTYGPAQPNLIFNPTGPTVSSEPKPGPDWPYTPVFHSFGERIRYRETVIDTQDRNLRRNEVPYRRFVSVRTGRLSR